MKIKIGRINQEEFLIELKGKVIVPISGDDLSQNGQF